MATWHYGGNGATSDGIGYLMIPHPTLTGQLIYAESGVPVIVQDPDTLAAITDGLADAEGQPVSQVTTRLYGVCRFTITSPAPPARVRVSADGSLWTWLWAEEALGLAVSGGAASSAYVRAHTSDGRPVEIWALPHVATAADGALDSSVNISVVTDS